jgi:FkbM family methyltransferase
MNSYSQLNQDINVLKFYNNKKDGYFVEIGASDGINLSNTYLLEKEYNWKGICIEPIVEQYKQLINNRKCICENFSIYNTSDLDIEFAICNENSLLSGIYSYIDLHKNTVEKDKKIFISKTKTLTEILDKNNSPKFIEYLSIDTEGSELEVLKGIDFNKYKFGIIDIEHNYVEPRRTQIKELLINKNYKYLKENNWDDTYINNEIN